MAARRKGPVERRSGVERRHTADGPFTADGPRTERTRVGVRREADRVFLQVAGKRGAGAGSVVTPQQEEEQTTYDFAAELPRATVDVAVFPSTPQQSWVCTTSQELTTALANCADGDEIVLQAGTTYTGSFKLRNRPETRPQTPWVVIRSSSLADMPRLQRVMPSNATSMPKVVPNGTVGALECLDGAHHWWIAGIEVNSTGRTSHGQLLEMRSQSNFEGTSNMPSYLVVDRCYIHGYSTNGTSEGILFNGAHLAAIECYISELHGGPAESKAIRISKGPGPVLIRNNHLESATENVFLGGSSYENATWNVADVTIKGNYFYKPDRYHADGLPIKNHFEIKNAERVLFEGNYIERQWFSAQDNPITIKCVNQNGTYAYVATTDVTMRYNIVDTSCGGVVIGVQEANATSGPVARVTFRDNLLFAVKDPYGNVATTMAAGIAAGADDVTIDHNTIYDAETVNGIKWTCDLGYSNSTYSPASNFVYTNNILPRGTTGDVFFTRNSLPNGVASLDGACGTGLWTVAKNVFVSASAWGAALPPKNPSDNNYVVGWGAVGFTDRANENFSLAAGSAYRLAGTDGEDIGCDVAAVLAATAGVRSSEVTA